jgi:hypothetical protein
VIAVNAFEIGQGLLVTGELQFLFGRGRANRESGKIESDFQQPSYAG